MPRKTFAIRTSLSVRHGASMRPRPDAAENVRELHDPLQILRASMRPRPDAAENGADGDRPRRADHASMRPRPDAAENSVGSVGRGAVTIPLQ